ncbi:MAG: glycosyltransferase family 39 protein [archaeon]
MLKVAYFDINENNYYWDETIYLDIAQNINENNTYLSSMGENFRAPLFPLALSFFSNKSLAHLFVILLSIISIFFAYLLGKEVLNKLTGLIAALFLAINPLYYFWSYKLLTEPLTLCLILLSLYLFVKFEKGKVSNLYLYSSFFVAGLAVLARYTSLSLIAALFLAVAIKGKIFKKEYLLAHIIFIIVLLPLFVLGMKFYGNPLGMPLQNSLQTAYPKMPLSNFTQNFLQNFCYFVPLFFLLTIVTKIRKKIPSILWFYLISTIVLLAVVSQKYDRFLIILLPAFTVISAAGFAYALTRVGKLKTIMVLLTVILSLIVVYNNMAEINAEKHNTEILLDATNFVKELPCPAVISNSTRHFEFFANKETIGYPATKEEFLKLSTEKNASCFVIDSFHGQPDYRKFINDSYKVVYANSSGDKFAYVYIQ